MDLLYKYVSAERALTCLPEIGDGTLSRSLLATISGRPTPQAPFVTML